MPETIPERTVLGFRVSFLWGALVGVLLVLCADVWLGVRGSEADCQARPTLSAAGLFVPPRGASRAPAVIPLVTRLSGPGGPSWWEVYPALARLAPEVG